MVPDDGKAHGLGNHGMSTGEEDSLESHMSSCAWTLAILSEIALAEMVLSSL